ncbi:MAG TPA: methyltransferase domain-containing protein [Myxococcaceae bacterium]|nr:methyltransferase domain-containing protein [Myxococcaceae bacterium]
MPDTWEVGDAYELYVGRWSRRVASLFLRWLAIPPGRRWLDVGCGTGALCSAIIEACSPSLVVGIEPSEPFLATAAERLAGRAVLHRGSAMEIPLSDASVDVVVSGLVLNFVPNQQAALIEMARVVGGSGTIGAYVWDYAGKMELIRHFWDAAVELSPEAAKLREPLRFPLCRPEALVALFASAGLHEIDVAPIDIPTQFASFEDYWRPFLGGQGPAPAYAMGLDQAERDRLRSLIRERLPVAPDGSISLTARAWAIRAKTD